MHEQHAQPDDVNDLESRLTAWQPSSRGLDADRMLYAAGQASVKQSRTRFLWPGVATGFAALTLVLGMRLSAERSARLALLAPSSRPAPAHVAQEPPNDEQVVMIEALPADSLFAARRAVEDGVDAWRSPESPAPSAPASSGSPIWQAWQAERVLQP